MKFPITGLLPALFMLLLQVFAIGCVEDEGLDDILGRKVAVLNGFGVWDSSAVAIQHCLEDAGFDVIMLDEVDFQKSLDSVGVMVIGAGNPLDIAAGLSFPGRERIRNLVRRGGGYVGLGAGAFLAADSMVFNQFPSIETPIGLYRGVASGPLPQIAQLPGYAMTIINLDAGPINPTGAPSISTLYYGGPSLVIYEPITAERIGRFNVDQSPAGWRFEYGRGRVVIASFQPEIEEDSDRDGSEWGSELSDGESDWFLLQEMVEWCIETVPLP